MMKTIHNIKMVLKVIKWIIAGSVLLVSAYVVLAVVLSLIPVNSDNDRVDGPGIYLLSNGVHCDIILPIRNDIKDWTTDFPVRSEMPYLPKYIGFGFGDRDFYINTPEWSDLTMKTAFTSLFLKTASAMHVDFYGMLKTGPRCRYITISPKQYRMIIAFIENSFQRDKEGSFILIPDVQYGLYDRFYEARPTFHLFNTCNTWTNQCLTESGLKACLWTPFERGILYQYRER